MFVLAFLTEKIEKSPKVGIGANNLKYYFYRMKLYRKHFSNERYN